MTNEEKAKEISFNQYQEYSYEGCDGLEYTDDSIIECEKSALEMAQWKDEQFAAEKQALIDKACKWLKENALKYDIFIISRNHLFADFENYMSKQMEETE